MESDFTGLSHEDLAVLAQGGREDAEEYLIRQYKDVVRSKAHTYFIIGAQVEDVVQEGMIGLFKAIKSYNAGRETTFRTYAERCITRQILDAIKAANRKKHSPLNTSVSLNRPVVSESAKTLEEVIVGRENVDPEELLLVKDLIDFVRINEKKKFSPLEVQVWNEYMTGKSYAEIALALGKKPKSIYNAMERIKKKISMYLE